MKQHTGILAGAVAALAFTVGACTDSGNPFAPTPPAVDNSAPPNVTLKATAPVPQQPSNSAVVETITPTLSASAATTPHLANAPLQYEFELLDNGGNTVASAVVDGPQWAVNRNLNYSTTYRWRVRAQGSEGVGPWSSESVFQTFEPPVPPDPVAHCGPPFKTGAVEIIACNRSEYSGHMSEEQAVAFLKASARHMNAAGVPGGPYGVLRKNRGNNCLGYSCDIICSGQGRRQKQYDVLIDERIATFGSPLGDGQRVDVCEIQ